MTVSVKLTKSFRCLIAVTIVVLSSAALPSFRILSDLSDSSINRAVLNSGRARNNSDSDGGDEPSISSSSSTSQRTKLSVHYNVDVDDKKEKFGICKLCEEQQIKKIVKMKHSNTTGLKRHLKIAHRKEFDKLYGLTPQSKNQQLLNFPQVQASCISNISFTEKIVQWLAIKYLPFSFFDDTATQNFFAALNPNLKYPKRDTMKRRVLEIFEKKKDAVINILKTNESKISFTVDGWTSIAGKSYYGITAHFVDASWKLQSIVLDFVPSNGAHTGKDIATLFYNSLKNFNIESKIQGIVLDNVASNTVFIRELQLILQSEGINFDCEDCHFRCFAHILNLGVQDILRELRLDDPEECEESDSDYSKDEDVVATNNDALNNPIKKIRALFLKLKRSEQSTNMLKSACTMTDTKFLSPKIDVCTRWNSTHDMLKVALLLKPALISLFQSNTGFHMYLLSEEEWCLCSEVQKFLKHFKTVSTVLGGDSYVSLPYVIVAFNMLLDKIENKMQTLNCTDKLFNAYQAGRDKLLKHYQKSNWIYCICLVLDPRHKIESFNATTWGKEMKDQSIEKFEDLYKNKYFISLESSLNNDLRNSSTDDDDDDIDMSAIYEKSVSDSNWRNELTKYYNTRRADKDVDILAWWSTHSKEYPCLAKMARDFLGTPATSVPAERLFSKAGLIIRKHRNQLTAESARSLICLNSWYMSNLHLSK